MQIASRQRAGGPALRTVSDKKKLFVALGAARRVFARAFSALINEVPVTSAGPPLAAVYLVVVSSKRPLLR